MKNLPPAVFLIEGGKPLELVKQHIQDRLLTREANFKICEELGVESACTDTIQGTLTRVVFKGKVHKDFTVPNKHGASRPKVGTEWAKRFNSQKGYRHSSCIIEEHFNVATKISFTRSDGAHSWRHMGDMFFPCAFLFLSADGPYAMYMPDVQRECEAIEAEGHTITEPTTRELQFEGCKRIEKEEWEIMVLQHELAEKKA
jgi:hypothetical protein